MRYASFSIEWCGSLAVWTCCSTTPASAAGSGSAFAPAQQTFRVEIHNDGTPQEVTGATPTFDATGTVVQIFTRDLQRNGPMAQALTAFKGRR